MDLHVRTPSFSIFEAFTQGCGNDDIHSRADFANAAFYGLIRDYNREMNWPGSYLGLRAEESGGRRDNLRQRGHIYTRGWKERICQPIAHWTGFDVFSYLFSRNIEPFHVYRCVRLFRHPWDVRKSYWLGGGYNSEGHVSFLRTYYPTLYRRLVEAMPHVRQFG